MDPAREVIEVSKVGIIGAGVSGIAAAKQLSHHDPVVFEASDCIGGVWKHCSYETTRLQSLRCDYEFSDFPWEDRDNASFPSNIEILNYLEAYAKHFDVLKFVKFNTRVVEIRHVGDHKITACDDSGKYRNLLPGYPVWEVAVRDLLGNIKWHAFEFLVMCIGKYGDVPKMPTFPSGKGPEMYNGKVLHAIEYSKLDKGAATQLLKGKKVVVVGYKKSAIDLAMECALANQGQDGKPCTMIVRTLHWIVPHYSVWGLPFYLFYSTRFSQFFHERPNQSFLKSLLHPLLSPLRRGVSKFIESYLLWTMPLDKYGLRPDHGFEEDYASCQMAILPEGFFHEANEGRIIFRRPSKWWFYEGGVEFDDGTRVEADVVALATGYDGKKKIKSILPEPFRSLLDVPAGVMPLYRGMIHPLIPNAAFVGYLESVSNLHSAELGCKWLSRLLGGRFELPGVEEMMEQTMKEVEISKRTTRFYKRHCISTYSINHDDEICEEMGWSRWRKGSWLSEVFSPYTSMDYQKDITNKQDKKEE
ncbi:hypothetical protein MLD38_014731 [Melastoma candidum]|uniref:Uncharacterized protein n=1 Tax=Melastoma candidum TaxID=119954 RepID=A0ACB9RDC2_9MYRT|nr:hypothetical protein MLD38_014731 [Melastoma candidum]